MSQDSKTGPVPPLSRRAFVQLTLGALAAGLAGCVPVGPADPAGPPDTPMGAPTSIPQPPTPTPTGAPVGNANPTAPAPTLPPAYTPVPATPASPPLPTPTPAPVPDRAALMAHWPAAGTSRVVVVRHGGVWSGDTPNPAVVTQMLDAGLGTLTDVPDTLAVWRALFAPDERVLLKVNCIAHGGPTQPAVAYAVAQRLIDAGLRPENVLIFDRTDGELTAAGYTLNDGGPGVQCHGARGTGTEARLTQATVRFYREFDDCDAVVNVPTPKEHGMAGVSVSLKNHYGSVDRPGVLHGNQCDPAIAEISAQPNVRDKTRLVVGAALHVSPGDWNRPARENALLLSFDPVALDTVARDILVRHQQAQGRNAAALVNRSRHLTTAQALNLGAAEAHLIDLREVTLG